MYIVSFVHNSVTCPIDRNQWGQELRFFLAGVILATLFLLGCQTVVSKEYPGMDWQYHVKTDKVGEKRGIQ